MSPDIVIVREGEGYRLVHGHLRLATVLGASDQISIDVQGEGKVHVLKTRNEYFIGKDGQRLPLFRN
jgi:hypothetical protein